MDKNKEIEEMARVACKHFDCDMVGQPCTKCKTYDKHCYTIYQAEILYNAGYRKIDENCAVITKDELKEYKRQAVKEFAEMLKEHTILYNGINVKYEAITADIIDELLKEYK